MPTPPRRTVLQFATAAALPTLTGCVFSGESTTTPNVEVVVAVENETDEYYQATLVVFDEHASEILDRDGVGWEDGSSVEYRTEVPKDRASELELTVFLPEHGATRLFEEVVEPSYESDTTTIHVTVTPGPDVSIRT